MVTRRYRVCRKIYITKSYRFASQEDYMKSSIAAEWELSLKKARWSGTVEDCIGLESMHGLARY